MEARDSHRSRARTLLLVIGSLLTLASAAAEEGAPRGTANRQAVSGYRISGQAFIIDGRTRQETLLRAIGDPAGRTFASKEAVDAFVSERAKKLENMRMFRESSVTAKYGDEDAPDGLTPVMLEVRIRDGAKFVPIPYAFYNSNEGVMTGLIGNFPNVGGTLQDLIVLGMYSAPPDENDRLQWTEPNFMCLVSWSGIKAGPVELSLFGSVMKMNRELMDLGSVEAEYNELALSLVLAAKRPLAENLWGTASVSGFRALDHELSFVDDTAMFAYGPVDSRYGATVGVLMEDIDWTGNFRDGYRLAASLGWERKNLSYADARDDFLLEAEASLYWFPNRRINPSVRAYGFANTGLPLADVAKRVRGVRNGELRGNEGLALNAGMQVFVARAGSAEFHLLPYLDAIAIHTRDASRREYDYGVACGAELLVFVDAIKSLPIKVGFGYDLRPEERNGSGKFFEVDFTFQLTY